MHEDVQKHPTQMQQKEEQEDCKHSARSIDQDSLTTSLRRDVYLMQEATVLDQGAKYLQRLEASPPCL